MLLFFVQEEHMHHLIAQDNYNVYAHFVGDSLERCEELAAWWLIGLIHRQWNLASKDTPAEQHARARHLASLFEQGKHKQMLKWFEDRGELSFSSHQAATFHQTDQAQRFLPEQHWYRPREAVRALLHSGYALHEVVLSNAQALEARVQVPALSLQDAEKLAMAGFSASGWHLAGTKSWYRVDFVVHRHDQHDAEVWVQASSPDEATDLACRQLGAEHLTGRFVEGRWDFAENVTALSVVQAHESPRAYCPPPLPDAGPWLLTYTHEHHLHGPLCFEDRLDAIDHLRDWIFKIPGSHHLSHAPLKDCRARDIDERLLVEIELPSPWNHTLVRVGEVMNR